MLVRYIAFLRTMLSCSIFEILVIILVFLTFVASYVSAKLKIPYFYINFIYTVN